MSKTNPLYFSLQVENKPYEPSGKYAFILENSAVVKISILMPFQRILLPSLTQPKSNLTTYNLILPKPNST